jgi:hypothetical protein
MIAIFNLLGWAFAALLALGASLLALKIFKVAPVWAVVIGIAVFTVLRFPIPTHAVRVDMPRNSH